MEEQDKKKAQRRSTASVRKASKHGETTQKMMCFKVDLDVWAHLQQEANKGRLINKLLAEHYGQQ